MNSRYLIKEIFIPTARKYVCWVCASTTGSVTENTKTWLNISLTIRVSRFKLMTIETKNMHGF